MREVEFPFGVVKVHWKQTVAAAELCVRLQPPPQSFRQP